MKRYGSFIIFLLAFFAGLSTVKALSVGNCDVLISYKANSSSDNDIYICKNQRFGNPSDNIYYEGAGNKVVLNNSFIVCPKLFFFCLEILLNCFSSK